MWNIPWSEGYMESQQESECRGPGSKHTAPQVRRKQELTPALGWLQLCGVLPLSRLRCRKKVSFLVSRMSVWACPRQCIMGLVPEQKHWTGTDAGRAFCRETGRQCHTTISLTAQERVGLTVLIRTSSVSTVLCKNTYFSIKKHRIVLMIRKNMDKSTNLHRISFYSSRFKYIKSNKQRFSSFLSFPPKTKNGHIYS